MRASDAGWLGKHLLPGIAGGFDLGILQLGDMGRWQHRRNDVAAGRQLRGAKWIHVTHVLTKSSTVFKVRVLPSPGSYILAEWCVYSGCE